MLMVISVSIGLTVRRIKTLIETLTLVKIKRLLLKYVLSEINSLIKLKAHVMLGTPVIQIHTTWTLQPTHVSKNKPRLKFARL